MAGNPRKFSEKIALHTQKQLEETAAFEQIMKEVMDVSRTGQPQTPKSKQQQNLLNITGTMNCRSLPNVHQMSQHGEKGSGHGQRSPRASRNSIGPVKSRSVRTDHSPYASPPNVSMLSSSMNATGNSGSNLCSPGMYQTNYLPIPMDPSSWRRANSDSALHSLMIPSVVPDSSEESSNNSNDPRDNYGLQSMGHSPRHLQETLSVIPNTVGDGPSLLEIPPSVSTGSLPDLTNFQFTPPLQQPIDAEDSQLTNSPYSTSPLSVTYSPTGGSPHPTPNSNNQQQQGGIQRSSQHPSIHQHHPQQQHQPHQQTQQQQSMMDNPLNVNVNNSFQNFTANDNMLTAYRSPQRPSPQNSPSPFRSQSPLDGQLSGPASPSAAPSQNSAESYYLSQQANALQQHFEQISMMDGSRSPQRNSTHWQGGGMINNSPYFYNTGQQQIQTGATAGITTQQSPQHHQPQTPQTPSSIPDIIFTDFSEVRSEPFDELLASEAAAQALREGLGHIDMDGFNMLDDPNLVQLDPQAEDTFRLDRL